jgi:aryl-alcohol dehydrogenase-like predicted oxidoreductase
MERRLLGQTDLPVSVLGCGGAAIGDGHAPQAAVDRRLGEASDAGLHVIDTAASALDSDTLIGRAVAHRPRESDLLTTCGHAAGLGLPDGDPHLLTTSTERRLQRLRTDHVDVVPQHSGAVDVRRRGGVIDALQRARRREDAVPQLRWGRRGGVVRDHVQRLRHPAQTASKFS